MDSLVQWGTHQVDIGVLSPKTKLKEANAKLSSKHLSRFRFNTGAEDENKCSEWLDDHLFIKT